MPNNTCEHCGSSQLISGLTVAASGGRGDVRPGLLCNAKEKSFFKRTEREKRETLFADLCTSCGTVKRLYVKDPKRDGDVSLSRFQSGPSPAQWAQRTLCETMCERRNQSIC